MKTRAGFRLTVLAVALGLLTILAPVAYAQNVNVSVTKTSSAPVPGPIFNPGDLIQYIITVRNSAPATDTAVGVAITDTFPTDVIVSSIGIVEAGGAFRTASNTDLEHIDDVATLPVGGSITYTVDGQIANGGVDFTVEDLLPDTSALLPLNDWAPLFTFSMNSSEADDPTEIENTADVAPPAEPPDLSPNDDSSTVLGFVSTFEPRRLASLVFDIKDDPKPQSERDYDRLIDLLSSDILEYAVFVEGGDPDDHGELDEDDRIVTGRSAGLYPGVPLVFDVDGNLRFAAANIDNDPSPLGYDMDFFEFNIDPGNSDFPQDYILAVRTTATWRNMLTLAYQVNGALMVLPNGLPPTSPDGNPDTYPFDDGPIDPETAYSSSFAVWDNSSGPSTNPWEDERFANAWAHPRRVYTPLAEHRRPRFDAIGTAFDLVAGEFLELRQLMPLDQWTLVIGLNLHGYSSYTGIGNQLRDPLISGPALKEVNVILTDIGADPTGPAGNGGFNPTNALETLTHEIDSTSAAFNPDESIRRDHGFNGIWVFHDTNDNGVFDPPVPLPGGGVSYAGGDYPMFPEQQGTFGSPNDRNPGLPRWQYVPAPPGGGDPWWKIRLRFSNNGRRRSPDDSDDPQVHGLLTPTPDHQTRTARKNDYFVVVRPDSGYQDISGLPGDGVGMTMGADFRAFIEPRRFNPNSAFGGAPAGQLDGGIFVSSQIPFDSNISQGDYLSAAWQEDPRWGVSEPWWPQRTLNATNAKPVRGGGEIHDLVLLYETNNLYGQMSDVEYGTGIPFEGFGLGFFPTEFDRWLDPFSLVGSTFQDFHQVAVFPWRNFINGLPSADDHLFNVFHYPYETVPFFLAQHDLPPFGPRSAFLPIPATATTLPDYASWPAFLQPDEYPKESQWDLADRTSRYLKQHIEAQGQATAMLGINLVGADDPVVNALTQVKLQQLTVAFWGPDLDPRTDFLSLDPNGTSTTSGVLLVEDTSGDGVFGAQITTVDPLNIDTPVQLVNLGWRTAPEFVDLTGDGVANDLNGDGIVTNADKAWVLRLRPSTPWPLPVRDAPGGSFPDAAAAASLKGEFGENSGGHQISLAAGSTESGAVKATAKTVPTDPGKSYWKKTPVTMTEKESLAALNAATGVTTKAIGPAGSPGDDLFVVVRTSDKLRRFQQFRAIVPSTLPERAPADRLAGIQLLPQTPISQSIYQKTQPEEGPVQTYYGPDVPTYKPDQRWLSYDSGVDLIEANIATKLVDLTGNGQTIRKNSPDLAVMGIDVSTNRTTAVGTAASGATGVGGPATFTVAGAGWVAGAFTDYFLIDKNYKPFRITGNDATKLFLQATANAAGTPTSGAWRVVRDPSFLEQVIIEFYDVGNDGGFNILDDLKPFDIDPTVSGIAIYRDNDNNPGNENGVFDPGDLPVQLDYPPFQIGQAGEPDTQVMMVFSTPGTDNVPQPIATQSRNRQWVPDTFGASSSDSAFGPDFFIVIRTSDNIQVGDDFRLGLVSWGPNTPSEPDPDTFPPPPASRIGEFDVFAEFPWGARALGFISFFTDEPYYKQYPEEDNSGFDWVRSTANKALQSRTITATEGVIQGDDVAITSVVPSQLPKDVPAGGVTIAITGQNFGNTPIVTLDGVALTIVSASNTQIIATIPGGTTVDPDNDNKATLRVTNSTTGKFAVYSAFTIVPGGGGTPPSISSVNPSSGGKTVFPVTISGSNFDDPKVFFEGTIMPVQSWTPTSITVGFPVGGLPLTGPLDVTVQNQTTDLFAVKPDGFNFVNSPGGGGGGGSGLGGGLPTCFIATAAYGSPLAGDLDTFRSFRDAVLLKTAVGAAAVDLYYTVSPSIADQVAAHPALAALVRMVLTPIAWGLESPVLAALALVLAFAAAMKIRRKRCAART